MKKSFLILVITVSYLIGLSEIQAQTTQPKLNQVELMKQFVGSWRCNVTKDSIETWIVKPFGKGYELYLTGMFKDNMYTEIKDLWGFDSKSDTWLVFSLTKEGYSIYYGKFITNNELTWTSFDVANPEKVTGRYDAFFSSSDKWIFIVYTDDKKSKEMTFNRIK